MAKYSMQWSIYKFLFYCGIISELWFGVAEENDWILHGKLWKLRGGSFIRSGVRASPGEQDRELGDEHLLRSKFVLQLESKSNSGESYLDPPSYDMW